MWAKQMKTASVTIEVYPQNGVPREGRAAWLEQYGAPPPVANVEVVATLAAWESVGSLEASGDVDRSLRGKGSFYGSTYQSRVHHEVKEAIHRVVRETGKAPEIFDATALIAEIVASEAERSRRINEENEARQNASAEAKRRNEMLKAAEIAERQAWIDQHGSTRLQRMAAEGIECQAAYRDERLATDRPGWSWYDNVMGTTKDPRNPTEDAFAVLDEARKIDPAAKLQYYVVEDRVDDDGDETLGCSGYVAESEFLGRVIVFGVE